MSDYGTVSTHQLTSASERYVRAAADRFREELLALIVEQERAGFSPMSALGDPGEFASRAVRAVAPIVSPWDDIAGPFVLSGGVEARLGLSGQVVEAKAARRTLLRLVTSDHDHLYPLWQFDGRSVLKGLPAVLSLFPENQLDGWTLAAWLRTPDPDLGESPIDALIRGDTDMVLAAARCAADCLAG